MAKEQRTLSKKAWTGSQPSEKGGEFQQPPRLYAADKTRTGRLPGNLQCRPGANRAKVTKTVTTRVELKRALAGTKRAARSFDGRAKRGQGRRVKSRWLSLKALPEN